MSYRIEKNIHIYIHIYIYIYLGDLMDEENVLDFLTSLEAMDLPDRIEEVNAKILSKIVEETDFVAVLFCKSFFSLLIIKLSLSQKHSEDRIIRNVFNIHPFISNKISCMQISL